MLDDVPPEELDTSPPAIFHQTYYHPRTLHLTYTYGVILRIQKMLRSVVLGEREEVERIFSHLPAICSLLFKLITSKNDRSELVIRRLYQVRRAAYDIEDIGAINQLYQQQKHPTSPSLRYSIAEFKEIFSNLLHEVGFSWSSVYKPMPFFIIPDAAAASSLSKGASSRYYGGLWSLSDDETVFGIESKEEIIQWIFNADYSCMPPNVLSIEGEVGVGKTTLAQVIYNYFVAEVPSRFDLLLWTLMPPLYSDFKRYLVEIIRSFTNQSQSYLQGMDEETLEHTLRGILAGRNYLLVLDDYAGVFTVIWEDLIEILEVGLPGSTVILVSSQLVSVANKRWKLQGLSESDSWSLFSTCAGFDNVEEKERPLFLTRIGRSIVDSCHGCPLVIKTLGRILRTNRDEMFWMDVEKSSYGRYSPTVRDRAASNAFTTNLEHLTPDLLHCLYVSSILSNSKVMPMDELIFSWMGLGLLQSRDENEDPIDIGTRYCEELELRCFIQLFQTDGRPMVILHQEGTEFRQIVRELGFASSTTPLRQACRFLIWTGDESSTDQGLPPNLDTVRTFKFQGYVGHVSELFLEELFSKLKLTRILLLDGSKFQKLPHSIERLKLLRHLSLAGNDSLRELPNSICKLRNLQTLNLTGCDKLRRLPANMGALVSLRHLFLSINLTNVLTVALRSWTSLRHLRICSSSGYLNSLSDEISNLTALKVLQIHDCPSIASLPNSIKGLTSLIELSILNCEMLDLTNWDGLGGLRGLQYLQIQGLPKLTKFPEGLHSSSDSLQHLVVSNCQNLIALPECTEECINLVEMVIENCSDFVALPKGINKIKTLQVLKIINCPKLVARYQRREGYDWHLISHIPNFQLIQLSVYQKKSMPVPSQRGYKDVLNLGAGEALKKKEEIRLGIHSSRQTPWSTFGYNGEVGSSLQGSHYLSKVTGEVTKDPSFIFFLLPEDYEIEEDTLIQLWMAGEYINDEQDGEVHFNSFLKTGYLLPRGTNFMSGKYRYRINAQKINELRFSQKDRASCYLQWNKQFCDMDAESIQHVSLGCSAEIDTTTFGILEKFTQLRTLLFLGNRGHRLIRMPSHLFSSLSELLTLDLSRTLMEEVPSSIRHMIHLRYLDLSWTLIKWLPDVLCSLAQLQTLRLRGCSNLRVLPDRLNQLKNLRHLDFDVLGQLAAMPKRIGALVHLRTLPAFLVGIEEGCKIKEFAKLSNLSGDLCIANLENVECASVASEAYAYLRGKRCLKKLELRWTASEICGTHQDSYQILEQLEPPTSLEELQIMCYEDLQFPLWMGNPKFERLARIKFYMCENLFELPRVELLPSLVHLELVGLNKLKSIKLQRMYYAFPKLVKLEISEMQILRVWNWQKKEGSDFRSLTHLIINDCPEFDEFNVLSHLPSIKYFEIRECPKLHSLSDRELPDTLEELIVDECPQIQKSYVEGEGEDWYKIVHVPNISI